MRINNINQVVFWGVGIILCLPIVVLPPNFQPSDWTRVIIFRMIIPFITSILIFYFFYKKNISLAIPKWSLSGYLPILILAGFFAATITATIFSQNITFSIFGSPTRAGGVLNLLFLFVFSILAALFINKNQWEKLLGVLFVTGILASLFAVVQYFNLLRNVFISYEGGSTPSFFGNSTILATYMLFLSFLAFVFFIQKQARKEKLAYGALCLLFLFTIFITGSRAAYLALLAGFLYFFLFYPYPRRYKTLKIAAASLLLLTVLAIALFNFFPQLGQKNAILNTIATRVSITRIAKDIFGTRLSAWKMTWQAIQEKPLLGFGPENFYIGFEKYYDPTAFALPKLLWDRPHNILLDVAVHSGIFSALLYLCFWIVLFWKLGIVKNAQKKDNYYADNTLKIHGVQTMFIGYLIVLFFNFDSFETHLISFFFIGYSFYLMFLQSEKVTLLPGQRTLPAKKAAMAVFLAAAAVFIWFWNVRPLYLNEKITHAKNLASQQYCKKALSISNNESWEKAGILKSYAILLYSDIIKSCAFIEPEKEVAYSKKMVSLLKVAANTQPAFSRTWLFMGSFTNVLAAREENADTKNALLQESMGYLKKALELSPKRQEAFAEMGKNYLIAQNYQAMEAVGKECIAIDRRFGECYWHLGVAQVFLNKQEEGKKSIELALSNGYSTPPYKQLAVAYMSQKNWIEAVAAYEKISIYYTDKAASASHHATLAFLYKQTGDYTKAGQSALEVFKLQPENPETIQFIKLLLGEKPNDIILNSSLAFIYQQPGPKREILKAKGIYLHLLEIYPKNTDYRWELIKIQYELKEYDKAYQEAIVLMELRPSSKEQMEKFIQTLPQEYWTYYVNTR